MRRLYPTAPASPAAPAAPGHPQDLGALGALPPPDAAAAGRPYPGTGAYLAAPQQVGSRQVRLAASHKGCSACSACTAGR